MALATGATATLAGAFETVYGVKPADGFRRLAFVSSNFGGERPKIADDTLGMGREPQRPSDDKLKVDGDIVVPACARTLGFWLKGLLGNPVSEGAAGAYHHTYTSGAAALPSLTIETGYPAVPSYAVATGAVVGKMALRFQGSGTASATFSLIAQNETTAGATGAAGLSSWEQKRFSAFSGMLKRSGAALGNFVSGDIAFDNKASAAAGLRSDGLAPGVDLGVASLTGNVVVRFDNTDLLDAAMAGDAVDFEFSWTVDAATKLLLRVPQVDLPRAKRPVTGPGGVQVTFPWQASAPSGGRMLTATLFNDVESY